MTHLVKIKNNKVTEAPQHFKAPNDIFIQDFNKNEALMIEYGFNYELTDAEYNAFKSGFSYSVVNNIFVYDEADFNKRNRLKEIEKELVDTDIAYQTAISTPVQYINGLTYQPMYAEKYFILSATGVNCNVWDYTELNETEFTSTELRQLALFLSQVQEPAFQARKNARKLLLQEKAQLETQ